MAIAVEVGDMTASAVGIVVEVATFGESLATGLAAVATGIVILVETAGKATDADGIAVSVPTVGVVAVRVGVANPPPRASMKIPNISMTPSTVKNTMAGAHPLINCAGPRGLSNLRV